VMLRRLGKVSALYMLIMLFPSCNSGLDQTVVPYVVETSAAGKANQEYYLIDFQLITDRFSSKANIRIRDLNNGKLSDPEIIDINNDNLPDYLKVNIPVSCEEPLRPFEMILTRSSGKINLKYEALVPSGAVTIKFLKSDPQDILESGGSCAIAISENFTRLYSDPATLEIFAPGEWTYTNGFFLNALCYLDELSGKDQYLGYIRSWYDLFVDENGIIDTTKFHIEEYRLDDVLPGRALLYLYHKTGETRYLKAAEKLLLLLENQPRTTEGGYWHKKVYDWQMWLDGIYMGDVFMLQYAEMFNNPEMTDEAISQIRLIHRHTLDTVTGLLYHGWDESRSKIWADPQKGTSPEFWGRGMGWYMMALVDALDYIPQTHPERAQILQILQDLSDAVIRYQDKDSGLWYQVVDKAGIAGNWPETSCTAMFAYAFVKGNKMGYLPDKFKESGEKAYRSILENLVLFDDSGGFYLTGTVKVGTLNIEVSNGSYEYYISVDRRVNDFKGVAALLYLAIADEYLKNTGI